MSRPRTSARPRRDFEWLWAGQTVSVFGSVVSQLAIPTTAIFVLHANAFTIGALEAVQFAPFPLLGLPAGVFVDRWPRRRVLMTCDAVRALALAAVPVAAYAHALTVALLFAVALLNGIATVFFDVAYQAILPDLAEGPALERSNARLEFSNSASRIAGNGLAGGLISLAGAPMAVAVDAVSFAVSLFTLSRVRAVAAHAVAPRGSTAFWRELREGIDVVRSNSALARIVGCTATWNFANALGGAVYLVFAYRLLHLSAAVVGIVFAVGNAGFIGALFANRFVSKFGRARALVFGNGFSSIVQPLVPLAAFVPAPAAIALLLCAELVTSAVVPIYNITQLSWRQSVVPPSLQGRMNATVRTVVWGTLPLGSFVGGAMSLRIGIVPTLFVASGIGLLSSAWLLGPAVASIDGDAARA